MSKRMREGNRAVNAVREKIQKKFFSDKISVSMTETDRDIDTRKKEALKVGEEYTDKDGTVWYRMESGGITNKTRGFYGVPMFCPTKSCGKIMGGAESKLNSKSYMRFGHCYSCQLEKERLLRQENKLEDYYENNKKKNIEAYLKDMEDLLIECIEDDKDVYKVISSSEGDEQTWKGLGISDEEIEKFQNFVDKMKKKIGKDIKTKKDNKDK